MGNASVLRGTKSAASSALRRTTTPITAASATTSAHWGPSVAGESVDVPRARISAASSVLILRPIYAIAAGAESAVLRTRSVRMASALAERECQIATAVAWIQIQIPTTAVAAGKGAAMERSANPGVASAHRG